MELILSLVLLTAYIKDDLPDLPPQPPQPTPPSRLDGPPI